MKEFKALVTAQPETIDRYIRNGKIIPDIDSSKSFRIGTIKAYAQKFGWTIINDSNRKALFMQMVQQMDMSYSYKPVFLKVMLEHASEDGTIALDQLVLRIMSFYSELITSGKTAEKANSVFASSTCTFEDAKKTILTYPYNRFHTMQVLAMDEEKTHIAFNSNLWVQLTDEDKTSIIELCDQNIITYYARI